MQLITNCNLYVMRLMTGLILCFMCVYGICTWEHTCVQVCFSMCACMCMCMCEARIIGIYSHILLPPYFLRQVLSLIPELITAARLAGQWAPKSTCSAWPLSTGLQICTTNSLCIWMLGIYLGTPCLFTESVTHYISPVLSSELIKFKENTYFY